MADIAKNAHKLKLANSRKRFKELQELKKKKDASQKSENINNELTPAESLTSSTHSSINNEAPIENTLPNYFGNAEYEDNSMFFDNISEQNEPSMKKSSPTTTENYFNYFNSSQQQTPTSYEYMGSDIVNNAETETNNLTTQVLHQSEKNEPITNFFTNFNSSQQQQTSTSFENMVSNIVNNTETETENYSLFPQETQHKYVAETQQILHHTHDVLSVDDPEIKQNELFTIHNAHSFTCDNNKQSPTNNNNNNQPPVTEEVISDSENLAIKNEIQHSSNAAQAEVKLSSVESLKQLSNQMAQLIEPEYASTYPKTDMEKRNLELAALLEQEKLKSTQQTAQLDELQARIAQYEAESRHHKELVSVQTASELSRLREDLQSHIQTIGLLVAEKTELAASLSQLELISKQKNSECEELQARLKASRSRAFELEQEVTLLRADKNRKDCVGQEQNVVLEKLRKDYGSVQEQREELMQDLLEVREKLKAGAEENLRLQKQNQELVRKVDLAEITIQQITNGEQRQVEEQIEKLTQEKFQLEKQVSNLNLMLKTMTKERDESTSQYQQYTQELNLQLSSLSNQVQRLQQENETLSIQEQNRVKHIGELERQLQTLQGEQIASTVTGPNGESSLLKNELDSTRELCIQLQMEKTSAEENYTKAVNEKEMLLKELSAKNESLCQLESMVEQLRGNQPDSVKLLATMESDKVAAAKAVQQNKELKEQMESMKEVFAKMDTDKVELTEKLTMQQSSNKDLLDKLQKTEIYLQTLTDAIEIKDRELSHLRDMSADVNKQILVQEQLSDRLRHYEAQDTSLPTLQHELQEAKATVIKLTNEINTLKNERKSNDEVIEDADVVDLRRQLEELELKHQELESKLEVNDHPAGDVSFKENYDSLDKEGAMRYLEDKVKRTMQDIADLTEEKQRLEHLVLQLQGETETIGEYVALYQHQRMILKQKALEKDQQLKQLNNDKEQLKLKLEKLDSLIKRLVEDKVSLPVDVKHQHATRAALQSEELNVQMQQNVQEATGVEGGKGGSETAEEIVALLSEIKTCNLVQPGENFHHCPWCSGQLITV